MTKAAHAVAAGKRCAISRVCEVPLLREPYRDAATRLYAVCRDAAAFMRVRTVRYDACYRVRSNIRRARLLPLHARSEPDALLKGGYSSR